MLAALLLLTVTVPDGSPEEVPPLPDAVEVRTHAGADGAEYRHLFVRPATIEEGKAYPLVVFLHGAGERGDDPAVLAKHFFPAMLSEEYRARFPCFILAPQCPAGGRWANRDWRDAENPDGAMAAPLAAAAALVEATLEEHPIDRDRLYLTGLSMGGYGTWDWAVREPGLWAAALPICGGGDPANAARLAALPLWVSHGEADPAVPVGRSREMVAAVGAAGGAPIYVEYPGLSHDVWTTTYGTPDGAVAWLFRQRKGL